MSQIKDYTAKTSPSITDEYILQETAGGITKKITQANLLKDVNILIADNTTDISDNASDIATNASNIIATENRYIDVRQTVLSAPKDSDGYCDMLSESSDQITLDATTEDVILTWASGADLNGAKDYIAKISADQSPAAWDLSAEDDGDYYLYIDNDGSGNLTYGATKKAPYYGYSYPHDRHSLLHFEGADSSTTITDEWADNGWVPYNNAQIKTAQYKFGTSSLRLDGTNDAIDATDVEAGDTEGWTLEVWAYFDLVNADRCIFSISGSPYGFLLLANQAGGLVLYASSNGKSWNVSDNAAVNKGAISATTWCHICLEFDGSTLRSYVDGVLHHDIVATKISSANDDDTAVGRKARLGLHYTDGNDFLGYMDEYRLTRGFARYGGAFTPDDSAFTQDTDLNFFSIPDMKMHVGGDAGWTATNRIFVGQVNKASSTYIVTNYAIRGKYESEVFGTDNDITYTKNHNIGTNNVEAKTFIRMNKGFKWTVSSRLYTSDYWGACTSTTKNSVYVDYDSYAGSIDVTGDESFGGTTIYGEAKVTVKRYF